MRLSPRSLVVYAALAAVCWLVLAPLVWLALTSVKTEAEVYGSPERWLPSVPNPAWRSGGGAAPTGPAGLLLGPVRILGPDGAEFEPFADLPVSRRLDVSGADGVRLVDVPYRGGLAFARVDFGASDPVVWEVAMTTELPFDARDVTGLQLDYQPDDSWNVVECRVERAPGAGLRSSRAYPLVGTRPTSRQWRAAADDEASPGIRDWVALEPDPSVPAAVEPGRVRVVFAFREVGRAEALWRKMRFHYDRVFASTPFWRYFRTSVFLGLANALLTTLASALAAYAFARAEWPGRDLCFVLLVAAVLFPPQITMVPRFLIWQRLGAYDTLFPLWLPAAFGNALFVLMLREALRATPPELEDAARMDGCGPWRVFWHATVPQIAPSLAAIAVFSFLASWNDFLGPLLFVADQRLYTLSFGTFALSVYSGNEPTLTAASAVLLAAPPVAVFLALQRYVLRLSLGGTVKG